MVLISHPNSNISYFPPSTYLKRSETRLTKSININDGGEVIKLIGGGEVSSFPDGTFNSLTITHHTVVSVVNFVNILGGISHTSSN